MVTQRLIPRGFSLLELLFALVITLGIGMIGFRLFLLNEKVFQDQNLAIESDQNIRAVAFQIADDIRRAGQEVPVYAASLDSSKTDAASIVLNGSDNTHLRIREGFSTVESTVTTIPADYVMNLSRSVTVNDAAVFSAALGTSSPHGRYVYIWGSGSLSCWSWIRAELTGISGPAQSMSLIARQAGEQCHVTADSVRFTTAQVIALEESISIYLNGGSIWRTTATDMTDPSTPLWNSAAELARDIQEFSLTYFDDQDRPVAPTTLAGRLAVARINVRIRNRNGRALDIRTVLRNARLKE